MKFYKQYPQIVLLLAFSICLFLFGIGLFQSNSKVIHVAYDPPPENKQSSAIDPGFIDKSESVVEKIIGKARVSHNAKTNQRVSQTEYIPIYSKKPTDIYMQAYFVTEGEKTLPNIINLSIGPTSTDNSYSRNLKFKIKINGRTMFDKNSILENSTEDGKFFIVSLLQEIPYKLFLKMAKEKKVELQIGETTIILKKDVLQAFRDLLKIIEIPALI